MREAARKVAGEWLLRASIMQCDDALVGRVHLTEKGEIVFLAGGGDLVGRGVGHWVAEGPVVGFQIEIFQYTATSTKHVHMEPHCFRGIARLPARKESWKGEWYFCPFGQPPRAVGSFQCLQGEAKSAPSAEDCPADAKRAVLARLAKLVEPPPMTERRWLTHHVDGGVPEVHYVRKFFEPRQVEELERIIDQSCQWDHMVTRDTQEFGSSTQCRCGRSLMRVPLPDWQANLALAMHNLGVFHPVLYPANSVRVNAYRAGQGIHAHLDGPVYYPRAAIISLGSHCVFDFYPKCAQEEGQRSFAWDHDLEVPAMPKLPPGTKPKMSILLEPGSLLIISGQAFIDHPHGIQAVEEDEIGPQLKNAKDVGLAPGDTLRRGRRLSLTIRHLLPRCMCSSVV